MTRRDGFSAEAASSALNDLWDVTSALSAGRFAASRKGIKRASRQLDGYVRAHTDLESGVDGLGCSERVLRLFVLGRHHLDAGLLDLLQQEVRVAIGLEANAPTRGAELTDLVSGLLSGELEGSARSRATGEVFRRLAAET